MHDRLRLTHAKTEDEVQLELLAPWYTHIVTTDNGAETFSWPDGGTGPFRGEKNTNWEGGYRVPWRFPFLIDSMMTWSGGGHPPSIVLLPGEPNPLLPPSAGLIMGVVRSLPSVWHSPITT